MGVYMYDTKVLIYGSIDPSSTGMVTEWSPPTMTNLMPFSTRYLT